MHHRSTPSKAPKRIALWVSPGGESDVHDEVKQLITQLPTPAPELLVFPEAWITLTTGEAAHMQNTLAKKLPSLAALGIRAAIGVAVTDKDTGAVIQQLLVDAWGSWEVYVKHSTAPHVAFEDPGWSPEQNLSVWSGNVGVTICHDMYPSLFAHYLAEKGATLLINPSEWPVIRGKWETMLRARAIENQAVVACAVHADGEHGGAGGAWLFDQHGDRIGLTAPNVPDPVAFGTEPGMLYSADLQKSVRIPTEERSPRPTTSKEALPVRRHGQSLSIGNDAVRWGEAGVAGPFSVICLDDTTFRDPCAWVLPMFEQQGKVLYWLRVSPQNARAARALASAHAVELCAPTVLDVHDQPLMVVELYNKSKGLRWIEPAAVTPTWQFGFSSAFRMLRGNESPPSSWKQHLPQYMRLVRHHHGRQHPPKNGQESKDTGAELG